jgi:hypothetical protein
MPPTTSKAATALVDHDRVTHESAMMTNNLSARLSNPVTYDSVMNANNAVECKFSVQARAL